jgi:DDE superfamily endonuclease
VQRFSLSRVCTSDHAPQPPDWTLARITLHFTPAGCSWLNMVEIFFGIIIRQAIRRGTFRSIKEPTAAIGAFIDACNDRCQPFAWTKDADELLAKSDRPRTNATRF